MDMMTDIDAFSPSPTVPFKGRPVCSANATGRIAAEWGMEAVPCTVTVGLRSLVDRQGIVRHYCAAKEHEANVVRRFGVHLLTADADPCYICRRSVMDGLYTRIDFGNLGVRNVCDNCSAKADEGQYVVMAGEE